MTIPAAPASWNLVTLRLSSDTLVPVPSNGGAGGRYDAGPRWHRTPDAIEATYTPRELEVARLLYAQVALPVHAKPPKRRRGNAVRTVGKARSLCIFQQRKSAQTGPHTQSNRPK